MSRRPSEESYKAEPEVTKALAKALGKGVRAPEVILATLEANGYTVMRTPRIEPDAEGAHVYYGFPFRFTLDKALELRVLATMLDKGEAELEECNILIKYYHQADNDDGYEIRLARIGSGVKFDALFGEGKG